MNKINHSDMYRQRAKRTYTHIWARRCTNNKFKIQSKLVKIRRILPRAGGFAMVFFFVKKKKENWLISNYLWYVLFRVAFLHLCPPCPSTRPSISTRSCSPLSFGLSANLSARHSDSTEIINDRLSSFHHWTLDHQYILPWHICFDWTSCCFCGFLSSLLTEWRFVHVVYYIYPAKSQNNCVQPPMSSGFVFSKMFSGYFNSSLYKCPSLRSGEALISNGGLQ